MDKSLEYNKKVTKKYATSFYLASIFLPKDIANSIYHLYGFARFTDNLGDETVKLPTKIRLQKLQNWENKLQVSLDTKKTSNIILKGLLEIIKKYNLETKYLFELIKGVKKDIQFTPLENKKDLIEYCYLVAGTIGLVMLPIIVNQKYQKDTQEFQKIKHYAQSLGIAMQITNITRDIKEDYLLNRVYIPFSFLHKHNIRPLDIKNQMNSNKVNPKFSFLIQELIILAREYYQIGFNGIFYLKFSVQLPILFSSLFYQKILSKIEKNRYQVFSYRNYVTFWQKIYLIIFGGLIFLLPLSQKKKIHLWQQL